MADSSTEEHTPLAEALPSEIGGYRILRLLGEGGMGRIYAAEDASLNRQVAIKVMRADIAAKPDARQRFLREARAAAAVEHESLVPIYRVGEHEGMPYLVMPLLQGMSLETLLKSMPVLPVEWVIALGKQVAEGLAAAHAAGLIHRDIKPANIWIELMAMPTGGSTFRRARILDFGLARSAAGSDLLTGSGMIVGTPAYMPPEQAAGEAVDHRADIYSLGLVLYRSLTGVNPFERGEIFASLTAIATQIPPSIQHRNPQVPAFLNTLIMQMLAKQPQYRIGSAMEVARRITGQVVDSPLIATPASPFDAIDFEHDHETVAVKSPSTRITPKSRSGVGLILGLSLGGLMLAVGIVFGIWKLTQKPETAIVTLKTTEPGVVVRILRDGVPVADADNATEATLPPGTYHAELIAPVDRGLTLEPANFVIKPRERLTLVIQSPPFKNALTELDKLPHEQWMQRVRERAPKDRIEMVRRRLRLFNNGLDGTLETQLDESNEVISVTVHTRGMSQLLPLEAFQSMKTFQGILELQELCTIRDLRFARSLSLTSVEMSHHRSLIDLSDLKQRPIRSFDIPFTGVTDIGVLATLPIESLNIYAVDIPDLKPIAQIKTLKRFCAGGLDASHVTDAYFEPLRGLKIEQFSVNDTPVSNLEPLAGMPLQNVSLINTQVRDLAPIAGSELQVLRVANAPITSLEPLKASPLTDFEFTPRVGLSIEPLKAIATLKTINHMPAAEFFQIYK